MSSPITAPGWYRLGTKGLELVAELSDEPEETRDLVKVEIDGYAAEEPLW